MIWCVHTWEYYSAAKKEESPPLTTTGMKFEGIIPSEISQRTTNKHMILFTCGSYKK